MGCLNSTEKEVPMNMNQVDITHFKMLKVVGKGGFGKVNAVTHRVTNNLMAMKRMRKSKLLTKKIYVITAWRERDVMSKINSPFLVNLNYAFQDARYLYLLMPFMQGGDLRYYLTTKGAMSDDACRFYVAEIILGIQELHRLHIVYRDLKPDNILLDERGHVRISDFGLAVFLKKEDSFLVSGGAGTPGYQAPEVLSRKKYGTSIDFWSLGVTIYELLQRARPFRKADDCLKEFILEWPRRISSEAKNLITRLLESDPSRRLGCGKEGIGEIKRHEFFKNLNWENLANREIKPPHQPELDRANCNPDHELEDQFFKEQKEADLTEEQQKKFKGFEFNVAYAPIPAPASSERKEPEIRKAS